MHLQVEVNQLREALISTEAGKDKPGSSPRSPAGRGKPTTAPAPPSSGKGGTCLFLLLPFHVTAGHLKQHMPSHHPDSCLLTELRFCGVPSASGDTCACMLSGGISASLLCSPTHPTDVSLPGQGLLVQLWL